MKKRHRWDRITTKEDFEATCLVCKIRKTVLGKYFGVVYSFNDKRMTYHKTPPCFSDVNAERLCEEWYLKNKSG